MQHAMHNELREERKLSFAEGAIVAAGFAYRRVQADWDCPACFSRPLMAYAIDLDAVAPEQSREELLDPLGPRLANTAATKEVEIERGKFLALETYRRILSMFCSDAWKRPDMAERYRNVRDNTEAAELCPEMVDVGSTCVPSRATAWTGSYQKRMAFRAAHGACGYAAANYPEIAARGAGEVVRLCCYRAGPRRRRRYFAAATQILDEAIGLGARA